MLLIFFQLLAVGSTLQESINDYNIVSKKGCLILIRDGISLDNLCVNSFNGDGIRKNQIIDHKNNIVNQIQLKSKAIDDFSSFFYIVKRWTIKNDQFSLESTLEIPIRNCNIKELRIGLTKEGIKWKTKRNPLMQSVKGVIPYSEMQELKEYYLPCK